MKKLSLILALLLLIAMSLVSCGNPGSTPGTNPGGGGGTKPPSGGTAEKTVYQTLNERMSKEYSTIARETVYKKGEMELCSEYRAVKSGGQYTVSYVEESFATFEEKNGAYVIPESYKTTASGSATVSNGAITSRVGDASGIDLAKVAQPSFCFNAAYFEDAKEGTNSFSAKVKNPSAFMGKDFSCSDMSVAVSYGTSAFSVTVSYKTASGTQATAAYTFQ